MNDNFSDLMEVGYDVLAHHGIKGQRWGKQNGPPYPLNSEGREKFKKQVKKFKAAAKKKLDKKIESDKKYRIIEKQKRAEKRRRKILNDPKKLYKHKDEFTTDEIYDAIDKLRSVNQLVDEAGLDQKPAKKQKEVKLSKKQKRMSDSYSSLLANYDKFTPEELELAKKRASDKSYFKDKMVSGLDRPVNVLKAIADGTYAISNTASNITGIHDNIVNFTGGATSKDRHSSWLYNNVDKTSGRKWSEMLGEVNSATQGRANNYLNEKVRDDRFDAQQKREQERYDKRQEREQKRYEDYMKQQDRLNQFNEKVTARGIEFAYNHPESQQNFSGYQREMPAYIPYQESDKKDNNNSNNNGNNSNWNKNGKKYKYRNNRGGKRR